MKTIDLLPYSEVYHSGVVDVILPIQQTEFNIPITLDGQPDLLDIPGYYRQGKGNFWVALNDSEVIGTIALIDIGNNQGALRKMFVKSAYRVAVDGVAYKLLQILLDWCQHNRFSAVFLGTTPKFLAAHRFYEKNAFIEIKKSELPPSFPIMSVDTKFYKYSIDNT